MGTALICSLVVLTGLWAFPQPTRAAVQVETGATTTTVERISPAGFTQKFNSSGTVALRWPCRPLRWSMRSSELRHTPAVVAAVRAGIAEVQRSSGMKFREVRPRMGLPSLILDTKPSDADGDDAAVALAYTELSYQDVTGLLHSATVQLHLDRLGPRMCNPPALTLVVVHELGHVLGLAHSDDPRSVMYPRLARTDPPQMNAADRAGFWASGHADCWLK